MDPSSAPNRESLDHDPIQLDHGLESWFAHDLIRKPASTFRDHALGCRSFRLARGADECPLASVAASPSVYLFTNPNPLCERQLNLAARSAACDPPYLLFPCSQRNKIIDNGWDVRRLHRCL